MKKSCLVAAVLLSLGSGCLMPQEAGATDYYWDKTKNEWSNDYSVASPSGNNAKLPVEGFTASEGDTFYAGYPSWIDEVANNSFTIGYVEPKVGSIYGGYSMNGSVISNEVVITDGTYYEDVYGGCTRSQYNNDVVKGNKVTISAPNTEFHIVEGGDASYASSTGNEVIIDAGNVGTVYGGWSHANSATGNIVNINGGSIKIVTGGYGAKNVKDNKVTINGGSVTEVYGGGGSTGYATGNTVIINGGTIDIATGGYSFGGNPTGNTVIINGGNVDLAIGGYSEYKEVQGNEVVISNSTGEGHVGDVYASAAGSDNTLLNSNIVTWKDGDVKGNIFGRALYIFDFSTGDSFFKPVENAAGILNVYHSSGTSSKIIYADKSIAGFDTINFYLSGDVKADSVIIDNYKANAVKMDGVSVSLENDPEKTLDSDFMKGDKIYLIKKTEGSIDPKIVPLTANGMDYDFEVSTTDESLIATSLTDKKPEPEPEPEPHKRPNEETKALLEGHAAAALAVNQMVDNTINVALKDAELAASANDKDSAGKFNTFISANYNKDRVSTGSYVDVKGLSGTIGIARKLNNKSGALTYGLFLEGGKNKFDTSNDFASGTVHGKGDANSFGGGFFAKQKNANGMYVEGSLRVGRVNHDFEGYVAKQNAEYDAKSTYYGAHIGLGKLIASGKGEWDVYGKLIYTHINGATADVYDGSKLELDAMNSTRLRVGGRYNVNPAPKAVGYYAGLAYEYEFGGQADGKLQGFGLEAPTSKGSTGILELGAKFQPTQNFGIDLGVEGHAGKRRGVGGNVNFKWSF